MEIYRHLVLPALFFLLALPLSRCNKIADLQPTDESIPDAVVRMIPEKFPGAENIVIKTIEKDSLWEATYTHDGSRFYIGMEKDTIRYREQLLSPVVPEEVSTVISELAKMRLLSPAAPSGCGMSLAKASHVASRYV